MLDMNHFSYAYYQKLINTLKTHIPLIDFSDIKQGDNRFFILRHDVEFSVEKAYELAFLEHHHLGINSSYFFQIRNDAYNTMSFKNIELIKKINNMGHKIGLHVNSSGLTNLSEIGNFIKKDINLLQTILELPIDRFSFHRPTHALLKLNLTIDGLINAYDKLYFHYYENKKPDKLNVHYFSDSEHQWKYGHPLSILESPNQKLQLLIHPYSWSEQGYDNVHNFKALIALKQTVMLQSMQNECHNFPTELLSHEKL